MYDLWEAGSDEADAEQAALTEARAALDGRPLIPALKARMLEQTGDELWRNLRPPLDRSAPGAGARRRPATPRRAAPVTRAGRGPIARRAP